MGQIFETMTLQGDGTSAHNVLQLDVRDDALLVEGTTIPTNGGAGYAVGCRFVKTNAANGQCAEWRNQGTATSCQFRPVGPVIGYGVAKFGAGIASAGGDATEVLALPTMISSGDLTFVEHTAQSGAVYIVGAVPTAGVLTVKESADPSTGHTYNFAALRSGCIPEYDIFAAGTVATAGGAAEEEIAVTGVLASDVAFATYSATDDTDKIVKVATAAGKVVVTATADPSTTHGFHYVVLRPRGSFKPSHYIVAAGEHTTVGGAASEAITVSGVLSSDVAIVQYGTTDDTDAITKVVLTANTVTVHMTANPATAHTLKYMILRAY